MDAVEVLSIFPLPGLVFLPGELLPLHVFEPRYRALIADRRAGDGRFAMATLAGPGDALAPPVYPELGVGRIVRFQALPDGRSNLVLAFEAAAVIEEELQVHTPYRQVRARLQPPVTDYGETRTLRRLALQAVARLGPIGPRERVFDLEGAAFVDGLASLFLRDAEERRVYLSALRSEERTRCVESALLAVLAGGAAGEA